MKRKLVPLVLAVSSAALSACLAAPSDSPPSATSPDEARVDDAPAEPDAEGDADLAEAPLPGIEVDFVVPASDAEFFAGLEFVGPAQRSLPPPPSELEGVVVEKSIVGADNRTPISDTSVAPYKAITFLHIAWPDGKLAMCTGAMIAKDAVLTAAHCVYDSNHDGYAKSMRVTPGQDVDPTTGERREPFGSAYVKKGFVSSEYIANEGNEWADLPYEYAVVRTKTPIGTVSGTLPYGVMSSPLNRKVILNSYHGDLCPTKIYEGLCLSGTSPYLMHASSDKVRQTRSNIVWNYADMIGGASGAPLTSDGAFKNKIFAVNVSGADGYNLGVLLSNAAKVNINAWATQILP